MLKLKKKKIDRSNNITNLAIRVNEKKKKIYKISFSLFNCKKISLHGFLYYYKRKKSISYNFSSRRLMQIFSKRLFKQLIYFPLFFFFFFSFNSCAVSTRFSRSNDQTNPSNGARVISKPTVY